MVIRATMPRGFSVLEALLALMLFAIVLPVGWGLLARHRTAGSEVAQRAEAVETVRTVAWLLSQEASMGREGIDWQILGGDSMRIRAFRSLALVERGSEEGSWIRVCRRDIRAPAPEKDSVLLLGVDGRWRVHDLVDQRSTSQECPEDWGGKVHRWELSPPPTAAVLARVFESGSYHFANGALRYRRGEGGRQPLTPERIHSGEFSTAGLRPRSLAWELTLRGRPNRRQESGLGSVLVWRGGLW
jgi:hypothetical protein